MRDLIISIICLLILIIPCALFQNFSENTTDKYDSILNHKLIPAIERGDWDTAEREFDYIAKDWDKYKKISAYFLDNRDINEVNGTIDKTYYYVKMHDASNASGEAAALNTSLKFLHQSEKPLLGNLF